MTGATHILAGAAIYQLTNFNKPVGLTLAFSSHFLLDAIPHNDCFSILWNIVLGVITLIFLSILIQKKRDRYILAASFLALLPDIVWLFKLSPALTQVHRYFHFDSTTLSPTLLSFNEIILCIFFGFLNFNKKPKKVPDTY